MYNLNLVVDTKASLSIYEQIEMQLKSMIASDKLKPGDALPSIRSLAADLQISVITTKRAYEELEKEGLIRSVPGKGFYVCELSSGYLMEKQLVMLEKQLSEAVHACKTAGLSLEEVVEMVTALMEN